MGMLDRTGEDDPLDTPSESQPPPSSILGRIRITLDDTGEPPPPQRKRKHRRRRKILRVWDLHGGICSGCGLPVLREGLRPGDPDAATFDHFVSASQGGTLALTNGLLKHKRCNQARGNAAPNGCERVWREVVLAKLALPPMASPVTSEA
jgi:5-methylcytosine-specific restriction endonuclease McrA